jgi:tetratricopeptide (TPR) repeat protein
MLKIFPPAIASLFLAISPAIASGQGQAPSAASNSLPSARAIALAESGRCSEALPMLRRAIATATAESKRRAGFLGVRCAMAMNQSDAAQEFLQALSHAFPNDPDVLYLSVHAYSDLSTRAAQQLATAAPNSAPAHQLNAESLELQGKWDAAAAEYRLILKENPKAPGVHFRLGRLLLSKPDPPPTMAEDAKKEFEQELEIQPKNTDAEFLLGELARHEEKWDEAISHLQRVIKMDPLFADAYVALGSSLVSAKRYEEAIPPLERAVKMQEQNPAAHFSLATAYSRAGRKADADREFAVHKKMTEKHVQADEQRLNSQ